MMSRKWVVGVCLGLFALSLTASAVVTDPNIISAVAKVSSLAEEDLLIVKGGLFTGALSHVDRTFVFADANELGGIDFVLTAVDDKNNASLQYDVTVDTAGTLFLLIDNRVGSGSANDGTTPPAIGSGIMDWVVSAGFVQTNYSVGFSDTRMTAYALPVTAGTYSFYAQADGTSRLTYLVAAIPDGFNLRPWITGLPASVQVPLGETLDLTAAVGDDYGDNTAVSVLWEQVDSGAAVSFSDAASPSVTVTFPEGEGSYTLKMTATDGDGLENSRIIEVSVQLPTFAVACTNWLEACNDSERGPSVHYKPTSRMYVRNHAAPRRRIQFIQYDISELKASGKAFADSFVSLNRYKGHAGAVLSVYGVREELDNVDLDSGNWNNMPGVQNTPAPPYTDQITIETLDPADISDLLLQYGPNVPASTSSTGAWSNSSTSTALDEFLNADNDGTVLLMFVTFTPQDADFEIICRDKGAVEPVTGLTGIILRGTVVKPTWAINPNPTINTSQSTTLAQLSWTNPEPSDEGAIVTCDVYFGSTEPNVMAPDYELASLATGISGNSIAIPAGTLTVNTTYYWVVDVHDSLAGTTRGYVWNFNTNNLMPTVTVESPFQYLWLNNAGDPGSATAVINATVEDDNFPSPYTLGWEQVSAPEGVTVTIDPNNIEDITVILPQAGTYVFKLSADDGDLTGSGSTQIYVGATPCDAAKAKPGYERMPADFDNNCYVNMADLSVFAEQWLECHSFMDAPCS